MGMASLDYDIKWKTLVILLTVDDMELVTLEK